MTTSAKINNPHELLTPEETALYLGVSSRTLATWRSTGRHNLPFIKVGSRVRYKRGDLEAWVSRRSLSMTPGRGQ
ncbi:helix-turn-helix domain-containing protein [Halomonas organivorans]